MFSAKAETKNKTINNIPYLPLRELTNAFRDIMSNIEGMSYEIEELKKKNTHLEKSIGEIEKQISLLKKKQ